MAELAKGSTELTTNDAANNAAALLIRYSFDISGWPVDQLIAHWLDRYQANWVRLAVIEALYQGRYKAVSVEQILAFWQRRGQPLYHFNHEFERLVCSRFSDTTTPRTENRRNKSKLNSTLLTNTVESSNLADNNISSENYQNNESILANNPSAADISPFAEPLPSTPSLYNSSPTPELSPINLPSLDENDIVSAEMRVQLSAIWAQIGKAAIAPAAINETPLTPPVTETIAEEVKSEAITPVIPESIEITPEPNPAYNSDTKLIPQFMPNEKSSRFYHKLKAVVQKNQPNDTNDNKD